MVTGIVGCAGLLARECGLGDSVAMSPQKWLEMCFGKAGVMPMCITCHVSAVNLFLLGKKMPTPGRSILVADLGFLSQTF